MKVLSFVVGLAFLSQASFAAEEKYSVLSNGEIVGSLVAQVSNSSVEIDYSVSNNGRGPKLHEHLALNDSGLPTEWNVQGNSLFGGAVDERFTWSAGVAKWKSQADSGSVKSREPLLYIVNDGSPWAEGLYARALLQTQEQKLSVFPSGTLRIEKVQDATVGQGNSTVAVGVYSITGVNLTPEIVLLDANKQLVARISESTVLVRAGLENQGEALKKLGQSVALLQLRRLQTRLAHRFDQPVRIQNVRIFDPRTGTRSEPKSVVVFRNRIASVEAASESVPANQVVIEGEGGTLLPGVHDMHTHNDAWSGLFYLAAGITSVRDLGNDNTMLLDLVARRDAGEIPGPRVVRAGLMEGRSPYSARIGVIPATLPEGLESVRWYAEHGYQQLKIYNSMNPDWVKPLAAEAHRLGMRVSGHVPAFMTPDRAIRDGYDEINHINQLMLGWLLEPSEDTRTPLRLTAMGERAYKLDLNSERVQTTLALFKEHHTALDTTAVTLERLMLSRAGQVNPGDAAYLDHVPIGYQRYRKRSFVNFKTKEDDEHYVQSMRKIVETLGVLHDQGVRLLPGTDDTTGFTLHRELELYVAAGIPAPEVLRLATLACDEYTGRDQTLGTIEPGKLADFFLVAGDPTTNISAVRKARMVMKDGALYFPSELYEAVGVQPFASAPTLQAPEHVTNATSANGLPLTADMTTTEPLLGPVSTRHRIRLGKSQVSYTATFTETLLRDHNDAPQATISTIAYVREGVRDRAQRPVVFLFNGGPGASSSPLHFSAFGPRRFVQKDQDTLVDNSDSLLDDADLVFIDPVGTGFSRIRPGTDTSDYWSVEGDAHAALTVIRSWLQANGRTTSPLFIAGESYGGYRLATMMKNAADLPLAGLIFISPMLDASATADAPGNDLPYIFQFPTLAAAAWHHEKIDRTGQSVEQFFAEAAQFAQSDLASALYKGSSLSVAERARVAARMSQYIGLPPSTIAAANLRVDSETFLQTLLPDRIVGRLDGRVTGPKPVARPKDRPPAADDPALGLKGSNVIKSERIKNYLTSELGLKTQRDYLSLTLDVNFRWDWREAGTHPQFYVNPTRNVAEVMAKQPKLRVLVLGGLFDLATPALAPRYAIEHGGLPMDRVALRTFAAGHSPFDSDDTRAQVSQVVHEFVHGESVANP